MTKVNKLYLLKVLVGNTTWVISHSLYWVDRIFLIEVDTFYLLSCNLHSFVFLFTYLFTFTYNAITDSVVPVQGWEGLVIRDYYILFYWFILKYIFCYSFFVSLFFSLVIRWLDLWLSLIYLYYCLISPIHALFCRTFVKNKKKEGVKKKH